MHASRFQKQCKGVILVMSSSIIRGGAIEKSAKNGQRILPINGELN